MFLADGHCDTLHAMLINNADFTENSLQVSYEGLIDSSAEGFLQFFAVFESPSNPIEKQKEDVSMMIDSFNNLTEKHSIRKVLSKNDLNNTGIMALLSLEGLYFMEGDATKLDDLYRAGVRCMSLTWNPDNEFGGGVSGLSGKGLTDKGKHLIKEAFRKGILIDVSHISDPGFWDIAESASEIEKPFIATHSNARGICSHIRNLDDQMLKQLAKAKGLAGINMFSCFLNDNCEADINDVIRHIEYICALTGPDYVGFGSDFDGIEREKSAIPGPGSMETVLEKLLALNYSEDDVKNIASGNYLRVLREVL